MTTTHATHSPYRNLMARQAELEKALAKGTQDQDRPTKTIAMPDPDFDREVAEIAAKIAKIEAMLAVAEPPKAQTCHARFVEPDGSWTVVLMTEPEPEQTCSLCGGTHTVASPGRLTCHECGAVVLDTDDQPEPPKAHNQADRDLGSTYQERLAVARQASALEIRKVASALKVPGRSKARTKAALSAAVAEYCLDITNIELAVTRAKLGY